MKYVKYLIFFTLGFCASYCFNPYFLSSYQKKAWFQFGYQSNKIITLDKIKLQHDEVLSWSFGNYINHCINKEKDKFYFVEKDLVKSCLENFIDNMSIPVQKEYRIEIILTKRKEGFKILETIKEFVRKEIWAK